MRLNIVHRTCNTPVVRVPKPPARLCVACGLPMGRRRLNCPYVSWWLAAHVPTLMMLHGCQALLEPTTDGKDGVPGASAATGKEAGPALGRCPVCVEQVWGVLGVQVFPQAV